MCLDAFKTCNKFFFSLYTRLSKIHVVFGDGLFISQNKQDSLLFKIVELCTIRYDLERIAAQSSFALNKMDFKDQLFIHRGEWVNELMQYLQQIRSPALHQF